MDEVTYIMAGIHIVFALVGLIKNNKISTAIGGSLGLLLSAQIAGESDFLALGIFLYSLYILYHTIFNI